MWHIESGQLLAVHGDSAYYESLVLAGPRQIFARGLLCERIILPLENSGTEFEPEHQRWLTFSPLMAANTTKLVKNAKLLPTWVCCSAVFSSESVNQRLSLPQVIIQGMSSVQAVEGLDSLSLDLIRSKRKPKVSIKDFWSKTWFLVLATQTYQAQTSVIRLLIRFQYIVYDLNKNIQYS